MTYPAPQPYQDPNRGLRTAGTIAIWMWILITGVPALLILACCGFCIFGGALGTIGGLVDPSPTNP